MTLDEAIKHCQEVAKRNCTECGKEHEQLAMWLTELMAYRATDTEQKHGYWMQTDETVWDAKEIDGKQRIEISIVSARCSVCERWSEQVNNFPPYMHYKLCPHCGTIMDAKPPKRSVKDHGR